MTLTVGAITGIAIYTNAHQRRVEVCSVQQLEGAKP